jgi:undecaprenol kinase/diacylglycerol kinase (ATP)
MKIKSLFDHIRTTWAIDPSKYSLNVSEDRLTSFTYALAGCLHMLRYGKNVRIQVAATLVVLGVGLWVQLELVEWAIIILVIGLNWFAEFVNTAIEAVVNLASPEYHDMARMAKDVAAGAVLVMTLMAVLIALLLLAPPLWEKLS